MTPRSLIVANLDSPMLTSSAVTPAIGSLRTFFGHVQLYTVMQPEFVSGIYCFMVASDRIDAAEARVEWKAWERKAIQTHYYNRDIHEAAFALPTFLQRALDDMDDI